MMLVFNYVMPILSLLVGILSLGAFVYGLVKAREFFIKFIQGIEDFFAPKAENQPSDFGQIIDATAKIIGNEVGHSITQVLQGSIGGTYKGVNAELQEKALVEHPEIARQMAFNQMLPKGVKKNPLTDFMFNMIFKKAMESVGSPSSNGDNNTTGRPINFNL